MIEDKFHSINNLYHLALIMGRECNMNCPHCFQHFGKSDKVYPSDEFIKWLKNWACIDAGVEKTITFWGGEPLIYFDVLKYIVSKIEGIRFKIYTNGLLLDNEKIKYMEDHNFYLTLSYDFPKPDIVRSKIPSQDIVDLFNNYHGDKDVHSTYTSQSGGLLSMYLAFKEMMQGSTQSIGLIRDNSPITSNLSVFNKGEIKKDILEYYEYSQSNPNEISPYIFFAKRIGRARNKNHDGIESWRKNPIPLCYAGVFNMSIDVNGNVYSCQNTDVIVGNILKTSFSEIQDKMISIRKNWIPDECKTCICANICTPACMTCKKTEDKSRLTQCDNLREWNETFMELAGVL